MAPRPLLIGTRGSPLALWQARHVQARLTAAHGLADDAIALKVITTSGDRITRQAFARLRRQGPVHQGDRRSASWRRRRSRRALDEGPADASSCRSRHRRGAAARRCPRCLHQRQGGVACRSSARRGRRHVILAPRGASEAAASRSPRGRFPRQCRDAAEEARRRTAPTRRCSRWRASNGLGLPRTQPRSSRPRRCFRRWRKAPSA